ncbi:MAG: aminotransferase class V-fold PLP-dependent enzyme, partial [Muribaculaceae bacterium]|nr:aminotransferase class V-fold PLP-dependent enzyme [Muribaculaceae bacterium]
MKYPFLDLKDAVASDRDEIVEAVTRVIDSGRYIGGPENETFENRLAKALGVGHAVGTANGLDALRLIFRAYLELGELKSGDEVIVPANTYIASVLAISDCGLRPKFVEPDESTMNLDWSRVEDAVSERTRAVMTVHLYGRISWNEEVVSRLRRRGILIVEDNAQA